MFYLSHVISTHIAYILSLICILIISELLNKKKDEDLKF